MTFFTSDLHLGHKKLAAIRGFNSVDEMHDKIITNWNEVVTNDDIVYFIGDMTLSLKTDEYNEILNKLNGKRFYLIPGNHDKLRYVPEQVNILDQISHIGIDGQTIILCHYAMLVWPKSHFGSWLIHGHSHGSLNESAKFLGKALDVGIECYDYKPLSWKRVKMLMDKKPQNFNYLKHHRNEDEDR